MAIITKIREKSGVAILIVAIAMIAFILGADFLSGSSRGGARGQIVGEIDGKEIDQTTFMQQVENAKNEFARISGQPPQEEQLRQSEWNRMVFNYAYMPQLNDLGINVTPEELNDLLVGNNLSPIVQQNFPGEQGKQYLSAVLNGQVPGTEVLAQYLRKEVRQARLLEKYQNLFDKTAYATTAEAKRQYVDENTKADITYLSIPYSSVPDSAVNVTEGMIKDYYDEHSELYEAEANRELKFITVSRKPTLEDEKEARVAIAELITEFQRTENDTPYVTSQSDAVGVNSNFTIANPKSAPRGLDFSTLEEGKVYGPFKEGESLKIYKVTEIKDDTLSWMRASHILFKPKIQGNEESLAEAETKAKEVLAQIKSGADFAEMAKEHGSDGTKNTGGDLGWFQDGAMVGEFNEAVLKATRTGLLSKLVKTSFGYHIIDVTETKTMENKLAVLASIQEDITASEKTDNIAYGKIGVYAGFTNSSKGEEFEAKVLADSVMLNQALRVGKEARSLNNIRDKGVRTVVQWAYEEDRSVGDVSKVFELENSYLIAVLVGKSDKGVASFNKVKAQARAAAMKKVKGEYILNKLKTLSGSLEERKNAYGQGATVATKNGLTLDQLSLGSGFAPKSVGAIAKLKEGGTSEPILDENGVAIIMLNKLTTPVETADYTTYRDKLVNKRNQNYLKLKLAIEEFAEVEDYLYKIY